MEKKEINKNRKARQSRRLLKGSPLFIVLLIAAVLTSAVLLTIFSTYTGSMEDDIDVNGISSGLIFDSEHKNAESFSILMDVSTLNSGDTDLEYEHTVEFVSGSEKYDMSFDYSTMNDFFTDTNNEFYGFYFDILSTSGGISIKDDSIYIKPGELPTSFFLSYSLDESFADTETPLPFDLDIIFAAHTNEAPVANDDELILTGSITGTNHDVYVLTNDVDLEDDDLEITLVTEDKTNAVVTIAGTIPNQHIHILITHPDFAADSTVIYTISDGEFTDTAEIVIIDNT